MSRPLLTHDVRSSLLCLLLGAPFFVACGPDAGGPTGGGGAAGDMIGDPHDPDNPTGDGMGSDGGSGTGGASSGGTTGTGGSDGGGGSGGGDVSTGGSSDGTGGSGGSTGGTDGGSDVPPSCDEVDDWPSAQAAEEVEMLELINEVRAAGTTCGGQSRPPVGPLTMDPHLRCAARLHSQDMMSRNYFSHGTWNESASTCSNDNECSSGDICASEFPRAPDATEDPVKRCGKGPSRRVVDIGGPSGAGGENIAAGNSSAQGTLSQWLGSSGHCNNIMRSDYETTGLGYAAGGGRYGHYWTQAFND